MTFLTPTTASTFLHSHDANPSFSTMFHDYIFRHRASLCIAQLIPSLQHPSTESIKDAFVNLLITLSLVCFTGILRFKLSSFVFDHVQFQPQGPPL